MFLTFAIARDAPVGAVIAAWSSRLSRMYRWDVENDTFEAGQFLKGRSRVLAISPDGKYVVYEADRMSITAIGVSHVPYFTAKAFFPRPSNNAHIVEFGADGVIDIQTIGYFDRIDHAVKEGFVERVDPDCPFEIKRHPRISPKDGWPITGNVEASHVIGRMSRVFADKMFLVRESELALIGW